MAGPTNEPQTSMFDEEIDDGELLQNCAEFNRQRLAKLHHTAEEKKAKEKIEEGLSNALGGDVLPDVRYRIGSFVITRKVTPAHTVEEFEASEAKRLYVKPVAELE